MIRQCLMSVIALLVIVVTAPTFAKEVTDVDRFKLWFSCHSLNLLVEDLPWEAARLGLTKGHIETAVRGKLSAARLYTTLRRPFLHVHVKVSQTNFEVIVRFYKHLFDRASNLWTWAMTWERRSTGLHAGDGNHVLSEVLRFTDTFIDEYLRVNAVACQ